MSARRLAFIRVDLAALARGHTEPGELCEIGGISVSVTELRRTLGDSMLQLVLTNGEAVIDLVNLNRKPTVAQMLAKLFTDARCSVAGCDRTVRLEFDHRNDWVRVLTTELANLDLYCDHHHWQKTLEGWQLVAGTGRRPMVPPTDPRHPDRVQCATRCEPAAAAPASGATPPDRPARGSNPPPTAPEPSAPRSSERLDELRARLDQIRAKEAAHRARLAGQTNLFEDTG